ncbi:hypothetical protein [Pseudoflavitalea rhizosphaerae]|uniref:hypothetical protein n=1 Tax=Pseudoflavitalea rhizosphaerae TaxID=1884793 RepID=UPI000F8E0429|nr:hypothetical protein [Pseudoflavitalea rhizosphaerae]
MSRIYFDSNVYSKLRNNQTNQYKLLNKLLNQYKDNLSFFFSIAHIRDKKRDISEHKFADFKFIESFTKDNYIAYHPLEKRTTFYLATPKMVFDDDQDDDFNVRSVFDLFTPSDDDEPMVRSVKSLMNRFVDLPMYENIDLVEVPEEQKAVLSKIFPTDKPILTMKDMMTAQIELYEEMITNHQLYKKLRWMVDEGINNGRFTLNNSEVDFNLAFKDSVFKKSFFEFVRDSLNKKPNENIPVYDFYIQAYHCLDLLGISKDEISRKNNYNNLLNDGIHSYFAQYCDYYVSEDKKSLAKSRALYEQFEIQTKILTVDDFIEALPAIGVSTDENLAFFSDKLAKDIEECSKNEKLPTDLGHQCYLELNHTYLNFFDVLMEVKENDVYHFLLRQRPKHNLSTPNFREKGAIIDRCMTILGPDIYQKGYFNFEKESEEIRNDAWEGRYWKIGSLLVSLVKHHALKDLCLILSPFPSK